jgi:hypothetical protein
MEMREKIALYKKLLSDPKLTETQLEVIAKLLAEEKQKVIPPKATRERRLHLAPERAARR